MRPNYWNNKLLRNWQVLSTPQIRSAIHDDIPSYYCKVWSKAKPDYVGERISDFYFRFMCVAEPENFNKEKIGIDKDMLIGYLCDLFKSTTLALAHNDHNTQNSIPIIDIATELQPSKDDMDLFINDEEDYFPCAEMYEQIFWEWKKL